MKSMVLLLLGLCAVARADDVSFVNEGVIEAPIGEVWKVLSTSEGFKAMGPALAEVDLRVGGTIKSRYSADGTLGDAETIENTILAYEPPRMMAIRITKPPASFPFGNAWRSTWTVTSLSEAGDGKTLMRVASMGFGADEESLAMRRFFESGNQITIESIRAHFARVATGAE